MKLKAPVDVKWIASFVNAQLLGDDRVQADGINEVHKITPGDISFVDIEKYYNRLLESEAAVIIMNKVVPCPKGKALLITEDPAAAYVKLVKHFAPFEPATQMISNSAEIGEGTIIQPGVFVGNNVKIGTNCLIHAGVVIYDGTTIGNNVTIQGNSVIGGDAFYFNKRNHSELKYLKLESCGTTLIEDDVEIGACCTIDRGVSGVTIIGKGTKFDNFIHIGHGTIVGKNCLFAAQVGVAGKVIIGDNVLLYGQVGVSKDLVIESNTVVLAKSGVGKSLPGGKVWFGIPVQDAKDKMEELVWVKRIPELWDKMKSEF
ncbi:MAG: UDP-3-O-(3-hydroxymyristoyl)glucosamine N-acyltransferase [Bacteroidetes bacterium]|nr:UDP-3-O-(3-hydroxymyristoyl)glucosamine N-acyltransferase [Bacteroidota bacterium]MBK8144635.1 UDP-3-O-(3-hydroxymyristoyl)glucosamine N-acyltransferase [Bacteroidota bacterium]MBP6314749.1 UDP-3-O-(3-hydroxymyristoyl)glucosamine N-acyltransferase [Chitinophagaceae bacterium]